MAKLNSAFSANSDFNKKMNKLNAKENTLNNKMNQFGGMGSKFHQKLAKTHTDDGVIGSVEKIVIGSIIGVALLVILCLVGCCCMKKQTEKEVIQV